MAGWNDGYVAEVTYTTGYYREVSPAWLSLSAVLLGHRPPDIAGPFRYAELGCGQGLSPCVFAAVHPQASFHGFDFNPSHIDNASRLARAAGLDNAHFVEASFAQLAEGSAGELPQFDFIVLHGIWSWVSAENQSNLMAFIGRHLAPGGLVYISYNVLSGWASMLPVQRLMRQLAQALPGGASANTGRALASMLEIARADPVYAVQNPTIVARLEQAQTMDARYIAHEYFNDNWEPTTYAQVADRLAEAKCGYVGSATLTDNIDGVAVPAGIAKVLAGITDARLREAVRDLGAARPFRRDLFRRGTETPPPAEHLALLHRLVLTGLGRESEANIQIPTGIGNVTPRPEIYSPILQRLAEAPLSFAELRAMGPLAEQPLSEVLQVIAFMVSGGLAHPTLAVEAANGAARLNQAIGQANALGSGIGFLVSPNLGTAIPADVVESLLLPEIVAGRTDDLAALVDTMLERLRASGRSVMKDGAVVTDPAEARIVMAQTLERILGDRLRLLRRVGVVGPAPRTVLSCYSGRPAKASIWSCARSASSTARRAARWRRSAAC